MKCCKTEESISAWDIPDSEHTSYHYHIPANTFSKKQGTTLTKIHPKHKIAKQGSIENAGRSDVYDRS